MQIENKTAIVTGASSGIGREFSKALVRKGASVYGLARSEDKLQALREELGNAFEPVVLDVTDHGSIEQWVSDTFGKDRRPDILINNAGLGLFGDVDKLPLEEWETMIQTNLSGVFYMTRQLVPHMKDNPEICHIINIASIAGKIGNPQLSGYNASKFGVRGFTQALFQELRYDGIKVTGLYPGSIATRFFDRNEGSETHPNMMMPDDMAEVLINTLETPDNFLISDITMRPLNPKPPEER